VRAEDKNRSMEVNRESRGKIKQGQVFTLGAGEGNGKQAKSVWGNGIRPDPKYRFKLQDFGGGQEVMDTARRETNQNQSTGLVNSRNSKKKNTGAGVKSWHLPHFEKRRGGKHGQGVLAGQTEKQQEKRVEPSKKTPFSNRRIGTKKGQKVAPWGGGGGENPWHQGTIQNQGGKNNRRTVGKE